VLVDTGWSPEIRTNAKRHLGWISHAMYQGNLPIGQSVKEQLSSIGLADSDLDYILLTHLHSDHVSGLEDICGAAVETFELETIPFGPYNKGIDLFGDGTLYLVHTPGHSKGHFSVLVKTDQGWVLLVSDAGYAERSWKELVLPGITTNAQQATASLRWVQEFSLRDDCRCVLANHDPSLLPHIII